MKKKLFLIIFFALGILSISCLAQRIDVDNKQIGSQLANQGARMAADNHMNEQLASIENNKKIALENLTLVDVIQNRVFTSLTTVDKSIKQGKSVLQAALIVDDMFNYQLAMLNCAKSDPVLLLFAEKTENEFKLEAVDLILYINNTIMLEQDDVLMDVGKRDLLLTYVIAKLKVLRAFSCTACKQVYWAQQGSLLKKLDPWQKFVNQDKEKGSEILKDYKFISK